MKRPLSMSGAVRKEKLTDGIKRAKSALRPTQWKGLWIDMQAIIFFFMLVGWGITFLFVPKAFISAVLSLYFPFHPGKCIYRFLLVHAAFCPFWLLLPNSKEQTYSNSELNWEAFCKKICVVQLILWAVWLEGRLPAQQYIVCDWNSIHNSVKW